MYIDKNKDIKSKNEDESLLSDLYRIKDENIKKMNDYLDKEKNGK
jgi:hypothetical protein